MPLVAGLLYYGAAWCGVNLFALDSGVALLWPPNAVLLGFLLYFPVKTQWPGIIVACVIAEYLAGVGAFPLSAILMFAFINCFECILVALLLKFKGEDRQPAIDWAKPGDIGLFFLITIFVVSPFCAVLGASVYKFILLQPDTFSSFWRVWWFSDVTGLIVLTPLVLMTLKFLLDGKHTGDSWKRHHYEIPIVLLLAGVSFYLVMFFNLDFRGLVSITPLLLVLIPVWCAVRLTTDFTISLTALIAVFTALVTRSGYGPFYTGSGMSTALLTQEFLVLFIVVVLFVNSFVTQARCNSRDLKLYKCAMDSSGEGILITRAEKDQPIIYCNRGFENLTGYKEEEVLGRNCRFLNIDEENHEQTRAIRQAIQNREGVEQTLKNRKKNGEVFWNRLSIRPIRNSSGAVTHFIGVQKDVSDSVAQRMQLEKALHDLNDLNINLEEKVSTRTRELQALNRQLRKVAVTDHLTGVYNRRKVIELGNTECERCRRRGHQLSVLMMDLDYFKRINDRWGHEAGDLVLKRFADTVSHAIREMDVFGRWGGEEFVLMLTESECIDVSAVASKILELVSQMRVSYGQAIIPVSASVGIARFDPLLTDSFQSTVLKADKALYRAKHDGRGRVVNYESLKNAYTC